MPIARLRWYFSVLAIACLVVMHSSGRARAVVATSHIPPLIFLQHPLARAIGLLPGDVSAGKDLNHLLWPAFYILVGCVLIVFVFMVAAPLRRLSVRMQRRFPWIFVLAFCAIYSLVSAEWLLGPAVAEGGARISMLVNGQLEAFFRLVFFPHGKFSIRAVRLVTIWACLQGAIIWIGWMLLSPPQGLNRRDDQSRNGTRQ